MFLADEYDYPKVVAVCCDGCNAILPGSNQCTSAATTSTSTTASAATCDVIESLVQADAANNTLLTSGINAAWNTWPRSDKANFAAYKKRIENIVYNRSLVEN